MKTHLYLSLIPESLIASNLPPEEFASYYAVGTEKRSRGPAIFFELDPDFESDLFPREDRDKLCQPHSDGRPRKSSYLGIYRVLENIPLSALKKLYLVTDDGRTLGLCPQSKDTIPEKGDNERFHLFQEFTPVTPRVLSRYGPVEFWKYITDQSQPVSVPKIVFCELKLEGLSTEPSSIDVENLPYSNLAHLRDCLNDLKNMEAKKTKVVIRQLSNDHLLYRTVRNGFYVGDSEDLIYFPMPTIEALNREHYSWWRSALVTSG